MIPKITDVVETSSNLAAVNSFGLEEDKVVIKSLNRSSDENSLGELLQIQEIIGKIFNYQVNAEKASPIWQPKDESDLVDKAEDVYKDKELYGDETRATVIHEIHGIEVDEKGIFWMRCVKKEIRKTEEIIWEKKEKRSFTSTLIHRQMTRPRSVMRSFKKGRS